MWIWIKDLGSVSAEDWNLQWDLEHIHFLLTLTGVWQVLEFVNCALGHLFTQELWPEKVMVTSGSWWEKCCSTGILQPGAQKVHLAAMAQLGGSYLCLSFLSSERNFSWQGLSPPPMGSAALCGLGHLIKVWLSLKPWKPWKDEGWGFHHPNRSSIFSSISSCLKLPEAPSKFLETEAVPRLVPQSCHLSDSDEHSQESWSPELCQTFRGIKSRTRILREKEHNELINFISQWLFPSTPILHVTVLVLPPPVTSYTSFMGCFTYFYWVAPIFNPAMPAGDFRAGQVI